MKQAENSEFHVDCGKRDETFGVVLDQVVLIHGILLRFPGEPLLQADALVPLETNGIRFTGAGSSNIVTF